MNSLIKYNTFDHIIKRQQKLDRKTYRAVSFWDKKNATLKQNLSVIIRKQQSKSTLVNYLHGACFSPVKSNFIQVIQNDHFLLWLGLSTKLVTRHLSPTRATAMGYMNQEK